MITEKSNIPILIMAAGSSSRLGQVKQLLSYRKSNLINVIIDECVQSKCKNVYVVLGAYEDEIKSQIANPNCNIIINEDWREGLGKSISVGVKHVLSIEPSVDGVIIVLADQLYLSYKVLNELIEKFTDTNAEIILTNYGEAQGPPSLFSRRLFDELIGLNNDDGAKPIVKKYKDKVEEIYFGKAIYDVDTEDDLFRLLD